MCRAGAQYLSDADLFGALGDAVGGQTEQPEATNKDSEGRRYGKDDAIGSAHLPKILYWHKEAKGPNQQR